MLSSLLGGLAGPPDEEQGKKDDDHRAGASGQWLSGLRGLLRVRRKRLIMFMLAIVAIWFLFTHRLQDMLHGDSAIESASEYVQVDPHGGDITEENPGGSGNHYGLWYDDTAKSETTLAPQVVRGKKPDKNKDATKYYYEGTIKFFALPATIHSTSRLSGYRNRNQNILLAAANLKSTSALMPLACEMAKSVRTQVHMAFMGRNDLPMEEILRLNGIDKRYCRAYFHDARPDFAAYSSDLRAESSVANALKYIRQYLHPQAIIVDSPLAEETFFSRTVRNKAKEYNTPLIQMSGLLEQIESRPLDNLAWITKLDASALGAWNKPQIDVVIQAQTASSGSLIRLLQSLAKADYSGTRPPRLTVELPAEIDKILDIFLNEFQWPPNGNPGENSGLRLNRRIPIRSLAPEEAAIRFMESFYPSRRQDSHVLILSPNVQLATHYYQALRYYLLNYQYSAISHNYPAVLGIALDIPTVHINGSEKFDPPTLYDLEPDQRAGVRSKSNAARPSFLWEAPNTNAALYLGDSWIELHSFLSLRLARFHSDPKPLPRKKLVGSHMPAWSEYVLEFMRVRGYSFFYPGSISPTDAFASVRADAPLPPDEFYNLLSARDDASASPPVAAENQASAPSKRSASEPGVFIEPFLPPERVSNALPKSSAPLTSLGRPPHASQHLMDLLPFAGDEPLLTHLPHYAYDGSPIALSDITARVAEETETFRVEVGGCGNTLTPRGKRRVVKKGSAADLFCFGDEKWEEVPKRKDEGGRGKGSHAKSGKFTDDMEPGESTKSRLITPSEEEEDGSPEGRGL
jgi:hypothetical protein